MKDFDVLHHFWLKNYFPAQQIQPLEGDNDTKCDFFAVFWGIFASVSQALVLTYHVMGCQMKDFDVLHHFWLKNYFPAQQIQPLEGDNDTWLLIRLQMRNLLEFQIWELRQILIECVFCPKDQF